MPLPPPSGQQTPAPAQNGPPAAGAPPVDQAQQPQAIDAAAGQQQIGMMISQAGRMVIQVFQMIEQNPQVLDPQQQQLLGTAGQALNQLSQMLSGTMAPQDAGTVPPSAQQPQIETQTAASSTAPQQRPA